MTVLLDIAGAQGVALAGLFAMALYYWVSGTQKLFGFAHATAETRDLTGIQNARLLTVLVIVIQLGAPALLFVGGVWTLIGAGLLIGFTALATLAAHRFWTKPEPERFIHLNFFLANVGLIGGYGETGFIDLLDAERRRLAAEDAFALSEVALATRQIALFKALGWQAPELVS